ncbi:4-(cytidine 5'-diphospho)-2-C-methyl-D-erythritol kinase [Thermosynechococcus sp. B3]|uniref:4-(cytidine 5'-diphospho)-2-C-methyl-D-erythritol kinase n=1 Tax=Thermosynechococcus sp. B3 TaxID=2937793 RepID=UPI002576400A|nr:4-(cytidine 5'-diphospho)-2-C-methyl-D-erythritol kinase [Thermosynechococcus sp. B3]WJI30208.1 4-(cytidine 5'-diphospho)-2-C-methyl-D-erythritol kinase [Thermosynechococcus sp. B3]
MYRLLAPAKINLFLQIVGNCLDGSGYHELVMVMQAVSLMDRIELIPRRDRQIKVHCTNPAVPCDQRNLAYKAAALLQQHFPDRDGVEIFIEKRIPMGAGLAGGSTNGAAVLVGLDLLWQLGLTQAELQTFAAQLGADVPFCLQGGTALALGRGEQLTPLADLQGLTVILGKYRSLSVATPWAYQTYRQEFAATYAQTPNEQEKARQEGGSATLLQAIQQRDIAKLTASLRNDLEKVVLPRYPLVAELKEQFLAAGAIASMMSGSGPTVFALAPSADEGYSIMQRVRRALPDPDLDLWICECCPHGIQLETP